MTRALPDAVAARARAVLDAGVGVRTPGLQYVAVTAAGPLLEHVAGTADVARGAPIGPATTLMAYSMSKTVTAAAVLTLVASRALALDDAAQRFVDDWPYGPAVTVRQLLAHTSGIPNPIPLRWVHLASRAQEFDERAALAAVLRASPRLVSAPGTRYRYSNIGYWLLGRVVERASGQPFVNYVTRHVLAPLGIAPWELGYAIPDASRHAAGYLARWSLLNVAKRFLIDRELIGGYEGRWLRIASHYVNGPAFGGLVGSARGFGKFLRDQLRDRSSLLDGDTRSLFLEPQRLGSGETIPMTLGWHVGSLGGRRVLYKEGGGGGFHALMRVYRDAGLATVVLANSTSFDVASRLDAVDRVLLAS